MKEEKTGRPKRGEQKEKEAASGEAETLAGKISL